MIALRKKEFADAAVATGTGGATFSAWAEDGLTGTVRAYKV